MLLNELYPWIKALHVVAAITFVSGVLTTALLLSALPDEDVPSAAAFIRRARRWDKWVTTPAMVATWALGLTLGLAGQWFASGWLIAKLVVVVALSGFHGALSTRLRLAASGRPPGRLSWAPLVVLGSVAVIATLAVTKV